MGSAEEVTGHLARIGRLGIGRAALWLFSPRLGDPGQPLAALRERPRVWFE